LELKLCSAPKRDRQIMSPHIRLSLHLGRTQNESLSSGYRVYSDGWLICDEVTARIS
jgi:hypothetical protein